LSRTLREHWEAALEFGAFLKAARNNPELWRELYARARPPAEAVERARALRSRWHLLVLSEDWCGDAVNTIPVLAHLAVEAPNLQLRILARDENPDLMDAHVTGTTRSIPVVMALDEEFVEHGWWGPRPRELQKWFLETGQSMDKVERRRAIRRWYIEDRGAATIREVLEMLEGAEGKGSRIRSSQK
jgi:hypothetical protein